MKTIHGAFALALIFGTACGGGEEEHGVEAEFCEHFKEGPFQTVTAAATAADAPEATFEHTRVNVTLTSTTGGNGGFIHIESEEAHELILAISADVPMKVFTTDGTEVAAEATEGNDECTEVVRMQTFDFEMARYNIQFGPTSETMIGFGFEEAGEEHDHDHE